MSTISNTVAIPADDPRRNLVVANPDNSNAQHLGVVDDTYAILLSGLDTAGRITLIDMHVPPIHQTRRSPLRMSMHPSGDG